MSSLTREVIFGRASTFRDANDFTQASEPEESPEQRTVPALAVPVIAEAEAEHLLGDSPRSVLLSADVEAADVAECSQASSFSARVRLGVRVSWVVNISLLLAKILCFALSFSYAVLASAVDSLVDLLSQGVLAVAEHQAATRDPRYPVGRTRMAEMSVIWCAIIMFVSTAIVIRESVGALYNGFAWGHLPELEVGVSLYVILGSASVAKLALYLYCKALRKNPIMVALSEDHWNDVQSNLAAMAGALVAFNVPEAWWADPALALAFSLLITWSWIKIVKEQGDNIIGLQAPDELLQAVQHAALTHHQHMKLDRVTAYHHGAHYVVELEVLLPADMTVRESHDLALSLQHKVEAIEEVERAYVHVDYAARQLEEHKVERNLKLGEKDVMKPLDGVPSPRLPPAHSAPAAATFLPSSS